MQDNNLNSDEKPRHQGEIPSGNPEKEENPLAEKENSETKENAPEHTKEEKLRHISKLPERSKPKESNYQISLVDENLLKVIVQTKKGVKINSIVKEKSTLTETQNNEIYLYPKFDFSPQEVEIMISIDAENQKADSDDAVRTGVGASETGIEKEISGSNYQINLINENLLKVKIVTGNGIKIDSSSRDKKTAIQSQSNRLYLKPKSIEEIQEVEIIIEIDSEKKEIKEELSGLTDDGKIKLIPNPEVIDLINQPDYSKLIEGDEADSGYKNPFDSLRKLIRKNLTIGLIAAVILHSVAAVIVFYTIGKKSNDLTAEEPTRLIVLQDLPDPKIKLEDVVDPNKPPPEEKPPVDEVKVQEREITPRKVVKPPVVKRPERDLEDEQKDTALSSELSRELDSLRRLLIDNEFSSENDSVSADSTDSVKAAFEIPDSLRNSFTENDIGLAMYFPNNWKLTDQREINKNEKDFVGVYLTDTTAEQPGTMTLFIFLDPEAKEFKSEDYKTEFEMLDSNLRALSMEPKTFAGYTGYRFFIFNDLGPEKLSVNAQVKKQFFDQYKDEIEAVVRSIRIKKKEDL